MPQNMMFPVPQAEVKDRIKAMDLAIVAVWASAIVILKMVDVFRY